MELKLVLQQGDIDRFRATQMIRDKAQSAENGQVLVKGCNAALDHLGGSLRASRDAVVRGVAPLGKDLAISGEARLAANCVTTR